MRTDRMQGRTSWARSAPARSARLVVLMAAVAAIAGCAPPEHLVLVHGAFMGGWVWGPAAALLEQRGERVTVVDLPAHGSDQTPASEATLDSYVDRVGQAVDAGGGRAVVVGHSMAGMVISQYAERSPEKVKLLVYLAAVLPADGQSLMDLVGMDPSPSEAAQSVVVDGEQELLVFPQDKLLELMCADCSASAAAMIQDHYRDEPMAPLETPVSLTEASWGTVPKWYLFTAEDQAISPAFQRQLTAAVTLEGSETLPTAHTPQLSDPLLFVETLEKMIR